MSLCDAKASLACARRFRWPSVVPHVAFDLELPLLLQADVVQLDERAVVQAAEPVVVAHLRVLDPPAVHEHLHELAVGLVRLVQLPQPRRVGLVGEHPVVLGDPCVDVEEVFVFVGVGGSAGDLLGVTGALLALLFGGEARGPEVERPVGRRRTRPGGEALY
ncbi:translocation/assembly module TamB [Babesia caballi]|uniref:Translocation/assembly module TamB n=1 Tax=Babesia caballi TaxID=5871 RepID=A0AAV4M1T1_BABCB|nr:translocation/assembly module TamB [Babesia caballi]